MIAPPVVTNGTDPCIKPEIARDVVVAEVKVALVTPILVDVLLENEKLVPERLVEVAFVNDPLVIPKLVDVPLENDVVEARRVPVNASVFTALL